MAAARGDCGGGDGCGARLAARASSRGVPMRIAKLLRVTLTSVSVYEWRRAWRAGGDAALASRRQGGYAC